MSRKQNLVAQYVNEQINYGGERFPRHEVIRQMKAIGGTQQMIDRWFQGYEYGQRQQARRA